MPQCASCHRVVSATSTTCPACRAPIVAGRTPASARSPGGSSLVRLAKLLALGLAGGGIVVAGYYWFVLRPRLEPTAAATPSRPRSVDARAGAVDGSDQSVNLPGAPSGLAWIGSGFLVANRAAPGGFVRVTPRGAEFEMQQVPVTEPAYNQALSFNSVGWNGSDVVGLTTGAWFQEADAPVFTVHDPATLAVKRHVPAPARIGAMAWDGSGWWTGTRKNTADEAGESLLQRLDGDFAIARTLKAPASGCQGLAWDGRHLWWADVFDNEILELDVSGDEPLVVSRRSSAYYPSGLAWDGSRMWLCEYDGNALHRLATGAGTEVPATEQASTDQTPTPRDVATDPSDNVDELMAKVRAGSFGTSEATAKLVQLGHGERAREALRDLLWSDESLRRMQAERALKDNGFPVDRALETPFGEGDTGPGDTDLLELKLWFEGDDLHAAWRIHVGAELLAGVGGPPPGEGIMSVPTFARYAISVRGGSLPQELEKEHEVDGVLSERRDEVLATGLGRGEYDVSVFIHVQTNAPGHPQILNNSAGSASIEH